MPETPDRILRLRAVLERTGLSRSTMYRKMQNGSFPKNIQISDRCTGWRQSAIDAWMDSPMRFTGDAGTEADSSSRARRAGGSISTSRAR